MTTARAIAETIEEDLLSRRGTSQALEEIDDEIRADMLHTWAEKIKEIQRQEAKKIYDMAGVQIDQFYYFDEENHAIVQTINGQLHRPVHLNEVADILNGLTTLTSGVNTIIHTGTGNDTLKLTRIKRIMSTRPPLEET